MFSNVGVEDFLLQEGPLYPQSRSPLDLLWPSRSLAPYASRAEASRGRRFEDEDCPMRSPFARDRDRVIHCNAFRRLSNKTQVFLCGEGDHFRTRLTHSMEVAQIARTLARALRLDEDLAEAIALAHDIGHTPFGHAGERALNRALRSFGGFDHNIQTIRVLTRLEGRYAAFEGLNLSWETLEGIVKHNGPLAGMPRPSDDVNTGSSGWHFVKRLADEYDMDLSRQAGPEAQVAALADDIAYNNHDIDDGLRGGLFTLRDLREVPVLAATLDELQAELGRIEDARLVFELNRRLIRRMVGDVVEETESRLRELAPRSSDDIRAAEFATMAFSPDMERDLGELRGFLYERVYRHEKVMCIMQRAERIVEDLARHFLRRPESLPEDWRCQKVRIDIKFCAGRIRDFIAGMTDRYAIDLHRSLFDVTPKLR
jgi:dGTPase